MSLKKSLLVIALICLGIVSILSSITVLICSDIRQKILDTRPIVVTDYVIKGAEEETVESESGVTVIPNEYSHGELSEENQIFYWTVTILMAALPVLYIIVVSFLFAKLYYRLKLKRPLENLKSGMYHIAEQDLDFQIEYRSDDELGRLCRTFENMKNEIHKNNCQMWDMLQERKALTASVSHDIRTPLTVISGYLDYLEKTIAKKQLTDDMLQDTLHKMAEAVNRLERYTECVKDIQKIEDVEIRKESCDLKKMIVDMTEEFSMLALQHKKQLEIQDYTQSFLIQTDKNMLSKVLENIFDNAVRFSVNHILLTIRETKESFSFSIQDDGSGFTEAELKSAISFFYSSPVNGGDFGIGLSICTILCKKLDGELYLENNPEHGAKVTVKIKK